MANTKKIFTRSVVVERLIVRARGSRHVASCSECGKIVEAICVADEPDETGISNDDPFDLTDRSLVHTVGDPEDGILLCCESLNNLKRGVTK